ncbi:hypothetical protein FNV43_RR03334 [Rhamnella rubrinervis]|uniref:Spt5 KOW domain-containing protein n=1 Tax=Rhamnella rubrinervis TaxID=2594499 RepID=A0A8K0MNL7_9ROSA|nr:hypothetical protein FNV43_RR03334 [Rhamnella rubrinervis]
MGIFPNHHRHHSLWRSRLLRHAPGVDKLQGREEIQKILILEKHLERQRGELRKEKEDNWTEKVRHLKNEKAVKDSYNNVEKILKEGVEGPAVLTVQQAELKHGPTDMKFAALDQHKKTICVNDTVRVTEGPSEGKQVNRGGNGNLFSIGQTLRIRVGPLKGYLCCVLALCRSDVTLKLDSKQQIGQMEQEHLEQVMGGILEGYLVKAGVLAVLF